MLDEGHTKFRLQVAHYLSRNAALLVFWPQLARQIFHDFPMIFHGDGVARVNRSGYGVKPIRPRESKLFNWNNLSRKKDEEKEENLLALFGCCLSWLEIG